jgi:hypothetical protein
MKLIMSVGSVMNYLRDKTENGTMMIQFKIGGINHKIDEHSARPSMKERHPQRSPNDRNHQVDRFHHGIPTNGETRPPNSLEIGRLRRCGMLTDSHNRRAKSHNQEKMRTLPLGH